ERVNLIVTSPPYVTSYEYADLHQLPLYWLGYLDELAQFRKKFIGSSAAKRNEIVLHSKLANEIVSKLGNNKKGREVQNYFADMYETFVEMYRVLKPKGKACIVIGNTSFRGVEIQNAEVFIEQMQKIGFRVFNIIKREIPSKILPSTRDSDTGQFAKVTDANVIWAYPTEYILIMQKR
ncbi:MAG: DNA methyltransferase, partial [Flammeovirgaceae bacterium]|nr:DNA methyltransferase [Flammeovirgaceae bacterium]